ISVVADFLSQHLGKDGGHLRARQILTRNRDGLANELITLLEYAVGAFAYVPGGDARELFVAHRQRDGQLSVRTFFRAHAEVNKVVLIERCQQERRRNARIREKAVGLALAVK